MLEEDSKPRAVDVEDVTNVVADWGEWEESPPNCFDTTEESDTELVRWHPA